MINDQMTILVLGSTGMLGQALLRELRYRSFYCKGVARKNADYCSNITNDESLSHLLTTIRPAVVINCVANTNLARCQEAPYSCYLINTRITGLLAQLCKQYQTYLIQISTDHYFTGDGAKKHHEKETVNLCNEYSISKYLAEHLTLTYANSLVVRTNLVGYRGWSERPTHVEWVIDNLRRRTPITLFSDYFTSSIDVATFSKALVDLMRLRKTGLLNIASSEVSSKQQFIEALSCRFELFSSELSIGSIYDFDSVRRNESCGLDVSRAEALLGYALPNRAEVIEHLAREYFEKWSIKNAMFC